MKHIRTMAMTMLVVTSLSIVPVAAQTADKSSMMKADSWRERLTPIKPTTESPNTALDLAGTSWQLVKFQGGDDQTLIPDEQAKYTLAFDSQGQVSMQIDCNRGRGIWKYAGLNQLQFGPLALTRAKCPERPLTDRWSQDIPFVRSYVIENGQLHLSLLADGGIYSFEPQP